MNAEDADDRDEDDEEGEEAGDGSGFREVEIREQDRFLPIANIARIMKKVLPPNAKIAKDAKESIQECVSEFISFITSEASDKCLAEKRKTINGDDLLWAMNTLGFDKYVDPLKIYLSKYRESVKGEKPEKVKSSSGRAKESALAQPKSMPPPIAMMMGQASASGMVLPSPSMMAAGLGGSLLSTGGVSDLSSFSPYDNTSGSLLGGTLAEQSLYLAPGKIDSRLPPIPKSSAAAAAIPHTHISLGVGGAGSIGGANGMMSHAAGAAMSSSQLLSSHPSVSTSSSVISAAHAHAPMPAPRPQEDLASRKRALEQQNQQGPQPPPQPHAVAAAAASQQLPAGQSQPQSKPLVIQQPHAPMQIQSQPPVQIKLQPQAQTQQPLSKPIQTTTSATTQAVQQTSASNLAPQLPPPASTATPTTIKAEPQQPIKAESK